MSRPATARLKVNPPLGRMPVLQFLRPSELQIDPAYQRSIESSESQALIRRIAMFWNWDLCQPLVVSRRADGGLYVIDGQHRLEAARLRGDIDQLPGVVGDYATAADEAASFVHLNQQRRPLGALDLFKAALASDDAEAVAIMAALDGAGLSLAAHQNYISWKPGQVCIIGGIQRTWRRDGAVVAREALKVLAAAFEGQVLRYAGTIWPGIAAVCAEALRVGQKELSPGGFATLTAKLGAKGQEGLRKAILARAALNPELGQREAARQIVAEMHWPDRAVETRRHATARPATATVPQLAPFTFKPDGKGDGPPGIGDGMAWCNQCDMRVTRAQAEGCRSRWCSLRVKDRASSSAAVGRREAA